jgi:hypothetical protein
MNTMRKYIFLALSAMVVAAGSAGDILAAEPTTTVTAAPSPTISLNAAGRQQLSGHLKPELKSAKVVGRVPSSTPITLTIGLPVKDQKSLEAEVDQISDPKSPKYRHYLTPSQFAEMFGAAPSDYDAVVAWAQSKNLHVTTHPNRLFVRVSAAAGDVEQALNIHLNYALRPDGTQFYEPDAEPSLDLSVPVQHISHLDDYEVPRAAQGSGPNGSGYMGQDVRNAYATGSALTGSGQSIGIFAFNNVFAQSDINTFNASANMSPPQVEIVGTPGNSTIWQSEITLDIDAAQSMAPNAQIVVFTSSTASTDEIIFNMTEQPKILQFSSSFYPSFDSNGITGLTELAAAGQSFFNVSGDNGAYIPNTWTNTADVRSQNNVTIVGGTEVTPNAGSCGGEIAWPGSSGGILSSPNAPNGGITIPSYQIGVNPKNSEVSSLYRNVPDVSAIGYRFAIYLGGNWQSTQGTSVAGPIWAGFMALVNEQTQVLGGKPGVGFANPTLYALAASPASYARNFHDVTCGSNPATSNTAVSYQATVGYDLVTGLGSPTVNLISALGKQPPAMPGCIYPLYQAGPEAGWVALRCTPDAANDPIFIFEWQPTTNTWQYIYGYTPPATPNYMPFAVPQGTTQTFLACAYNAYFFTGSPPPTWVADTAPVGPGLTGCDANATVVTNPVPPPPPPPPPPVPSLVGVETYPFWSGTTSTAFVTLNEPAPSTTAVTISASGGITVPAATTVPQGQTTATFSIAASATVTSDVITVTANSQSLSGVIPVATGSFIMTGTPTSLTLYFRNPAPSESVVSFTDSDPAVARVPSSAKIATGVTTANVPVTKAGIGVTSITGTYEGSTYSTSVFVPPPPINSPPPKCGNLPC